MYFIFTKISFSDVEDKLQEDTQWGQTMRQLLSAHDVQAAGESESVAVWLVVRGATGAVARASPGNPFLARFGAGRGPFITLHCNFSMVTNHIIFPRANLGQFFYFRTSFVTQSSAMR